MLHCSFYRARLVHLLTTLLVIIKIRGDNNYHYDNWKFHFLPGSGMGLFMAIAVPVDLPNKNLYLAYNFEANYMLPGNETSFEYPPLIQRRVDRKLVYAAIETKISSSGFPGKDCLLRIICESAAKLMRNANGVLGDILHVVFTPSTSKNIDLSPEYEEAEKIGLHTSDCSAYALNCTVSFLDLISWLQSSH